MKCSRCGRDAVFVTKGRKHHVKSNKEHDLCHRCFRAEVDRLRAAGEWRTKGKGR